MKLANAIIQSLAAAIFVIGGIVFAWRTHPPVFTPALLPLPSFMNPYNVTSAELGPGAPELAEGMTIPLLYLDPANFLMWGLLLTIWAAVAMDAAGQWLFPSDRRDLRNGRCRIWPQLVAGLVVLSAAPWFLLDQRDALLAANGAGMILTIWAARRAARRKRPAVGFVAGWATALFSATLAGALTGALSLQTQAVAALAILPGTAIGMAAQIWIGPSIGYSTALIWAFCAIALTAMGSDPVIAFAAILGISGMAAVLIRAAS